MSFFEIFNKMFDFVKVRIRFIVYNFSKSVIRSSLYLFSLKESYTNYHLRILDHRTRMKRENIDVVEIFFPLFIDDTKTILWIIRSKGDGNRPAACIVR